MMVGFHTSIIQPLTRVLFCPSKVDFVISARILLSDVGHLDILGSVLLSV